MGRRASTMRQTTFKRDYAVKSLRIATRGSKLATAQTNFVVEQLHAARAGLEIETVEVSTKGDRDRSEFLYDKESVGFFTSEVERALLDGRADIAVHSLKDLPTAMTGGLVIAAVPVREAVCDVIVSGRKIGSIDDLPAGAKVGTSSLRRITQLKLVRDDLDCRPLRGNVETRLKKVEVGELDAIVVAKAGLNRLGLWKDNRLELEPTEFIPAPGQGALAVQTCVNDAEVCELVGQLDDADTRLTTQAERRILAGLHGGCSIPLGVYAQVENKTLHIHAILCDLQSTKCVRKNVSCAIEKADETADKLTQEILDDGGEKILKNLRQDKKC